MYYQKFMDVWLFDSPFCDIQFFSCCWKISNRSKCFFNKIWWRNCHQNFSCNSARLNIFLPAYRIWTIASFYAIDAELLGILCANISESKVWIFTIKWIFVEFWIRIHFLFTTKWNSGGSLRKPQLLISINWLRPQTFDHHLQLQQYFQRIPYLIVLLYRVERQMSYIALLKYPNTQTYSVDIFHLFSKKQIDLKLFLFFYKYLIWYRVFQ